MNDLKVSLQLYSVRDELEKDFYNGLKKVKEAGYDYVQFSGLYGYSVKEVKKILEELGLKCVSIHYGYRNIAYEDKAVFDDLKSIGIKYLAIPGIPVEGHKGEEKWEETVEIVKKAGEVLKDNGLKLLYHNHEFEFNEYEGKKIIDWLYEEFPDILHTEFDTCWVQYAGYDPCEYLRKYKGRSPVVHLKDFVCNRYANAFGEIEKVEKGKAREENGFCLKPLGLGEMDFKAVIKASIEAGAEEIVVEQDDWPEHTSIEAARISREYLKSLGY